MNSDFTRLTAQAADLLQAAAIMAGFLIVVLALRLLWGRVVEPLARKTHSSLDDMVLLPLRGLVLWGLFLLGLYHSLNSLPGVRQHKAIGPIIGKTLSVAWVLLAVWLTLKIVHALIAWYVNRSAQERHGARDVSQEALLVQRVANVIVIALGALYLLSALGLNVGPLLAGGAVGGIVLAVALQDTLANLFAGLYISIDKPVSVGDYIKLQSGEEGFVVDIGWRSTKVRLWANNVVVVPNSVLGRSLITNYFLPDQEMSVYVPCGVAYDSDLERVERAAAEVAREVMDRVKGASADWQPVVRWKEFADSAITFVTVLRVCEFGAQYELQSEFIKALHRRFQQDAIEIPFPVRTVIVRPSAPEPESGGEGRSSLEQRSSEMRAPLRS